MDYLKNLGLSKNHIYIIAAVTVIIIGGLIYYFYFRNESYEPAPHTLPSPAQAPTPSGPPKKTLVLVHSHGCGHCKHMMPAWAEVVETLKKDGTIDVITIEASQPEAQEFIKQTNIQGFPTIRCYASGLNSAYVDYDTQTHGDRTKMNILKFAFEN